MILAVACEAKRSLFGSSGSGSECREVACPSLLGSRQERTSAGGTVRSSSS